MPDLIGKCSICTGGVSARYHSAGKYIHVCEQCGAVGLSGFGEALPEIQMIPRQGPLGAPIATGIGMAAPPPRENLSRAPREYGPTRIHDEFDLAKRLSAETGAANPPPLGLNFPPYTPKDWTGTESPAPEPASDPSERIAASTVEKAAGLPAGSVDLRKELYGQKWQSGESTSSPLASEYDRGFAAGLAAGRLRTQEVPLKDRPE